MTTIRINSREKTAGQIVDILTSLTTARPDNDCVHADGTSNSNNTLAFHYSECKHFPERWGVSFRSPEKRGGNLMYYYSPYDAAKAIKNKAHSDSGTTSPNYHRANCGV